MAEHLSLISLRVKEITDKVLPWGKLFAERDNFEFGYSKEEGRLVSEYLQKKPSDVLVIDSGNGRDSSKKTSLTAKDTKSDYTKNGHH